MHAGSCLRRAIGASAWALLLAGAGCSHHGGQSTGGEGTGGAAAGGTGGSGTPTGGSAGERAAAGSGGAAGQAPVAPPFWREFADRALPAFVSGGEAPPPVPGAPVTVTIDAGQVLRALPRTLYGNNVATWD